MRFPMLLLAACVVAASLAAPAASARHVGPCTHEYFEALRTGDPSVVVATAGSCVDRLLEPLCPLLDPCVLP